MVLRERSSKNELEAPAMWALRVCVLVKPVEMADRLDLQHGTSAECLDVATDGKGGRPSTFVVEVTRTSNMLVR